MSDGIKMQTGNETTRTLAESFRKLARKRPAEKITIKEITDGAGVIRPTFYNHFQDKFEVIEWLIRMDLLEPIRPLIRNGMTTEAMVLLFSNLEREKEFYMRVVKLEGPVTFHDIAQKCVRNFLLEIYTAEIEGKQSRHKWLTPEVIAAYYAQSMCFAAEEWIHLGMIFSPQEMAEAYNYIISRSMTDVIKEM